MVVDKKTFKELKKQGGGLGSKLMITVIFENGIDEINKGSNGNLFVMNNGIYYDIVLGQKIFLDFKELKNIAIEDSKLVLYTVAERLVFKSSNINALVKMQNLVASIIGSDIADKNIVKKEFKEQKIEAKEQKQKESERATVSNYRGNSANKKSFFGRMVEQGNANLEKKQEEKQYQKDRIKQLERDHIPYCPKCKSTNITYLSNRKRLSLGRTVVGGTIGGVLTGGLGVAAGATMGGLSSNKQKKGL